MAQELLYTSAPRGLKSGSRGFCTVEATAGLSPTLVTALEGLSGYRHVAAPGDPSNPVVYSHVTLSVAGRRCSVVSRVADAGADYTGRTNKLAHHLALDTAERPKGGPAWLAGQPNLLRSRFEGEPRTLPPRTVPQGDRPPAVCKSWQAATGDAGWAGVLAEAFLADPKRPAYLVVPAGLDLLPLFEEAIALLPPDRRWEPTFTTCHTSLPQNVTCLWKAVLAGSKEAHESRRFVQALRIDLTQPLGTAGGGALVEAARTGRMPAVAPPPAPRKSSAAAAIARPGEPSKALDDTPLDVMPAATRRRPDQFLIEPLERPPALQRPSRWKAMMWTGAAVLCLAVFAVMGVLGVMHFSPETKPAAPQVVAANDPPKVDAAEIVDAPPDPPKAPRDAPEAASTDEESGNSDEATGDAHEPNVAFAPEKPVEAQRPVAASGKSSQKAVTPEPGTIAVRFSQLTKHTTVDDLYIAEIDGLAFTEMEAKHSRLRLWAPKDFLEQFTIDGQDSSSLAVTSKNFAGLPTTLCTIALVQPRSIDPFHLAIRDLRAKARLAELAWCVVHISLEGNESHKADGYYIFRDISKDDRSLSFDDGAITIGGTAFGLPPINGLTFSPPSLEATSLSIRFDGKTFQFERQGDKWQSQQLTNYIVSFARDDLKPAISQSPPVIVQDEDNSLAFRFAMGRGWGKTRESLYEEWKALKARVPKSVDILSDPVKRRQVNLVFNVDAAIEGAWFDELATELEKRVEDSISRLGMSEAAEMVRQDQRQFLNDVKRLHKTLVDTNGQKLELSNAAISSINVQYQVFSGAEMPPKWIPALIIDTK
ncbi:MAG: hypothetical protein WBC44_10720 [Planctomycetaceae bacterium]